YDWRVGLLGALLLALAVMPIQQSHFFTTDNWATVFSVLTMYAAVRAAETAGQKRWWVLFGLFMGLALASRINVAPLALMAGVAGLVYLLRQGSGRDWRDYLGSAQGQHDLQVVVVGGLLAALVTLGTFRLAQPYAFADSVIAAEAAAAAGAGEA